MTIAFAYDTPPDQSTGSDGFDSVAAEYEDERTIEWIRRQLSRFGTVVDSPWGADTGARILTGRFDLVFNITEGATGRNRESLLPAVCELAGVPCTGSDSLALGLSLDKEYAKILAGNAGVPTPNWYRVADTGEVASSLPTGFEFPVIVKPVTGGSSMGVHWFSKATTDAELVYAVRWVLEQCGDHAIVEEFIPGREIVGGILGDAATGALPVAELVLGDGSPDEFYSVEWKSRHRKRILCPADLPSGVERRVQEYTAEVFRLLGCRDLARADYRLSEDGVPYFIEMNPLPGLSPYYSVFPAQVQATGQSPAVIIERLVERALRDCVPAHPLRVDANR